MNRAAPLPLLRPFDPVAYRLDGDRNPWLLPITSQREYRIMLSFIDDMINSDFPTGMIVVLRNNQRILIRKREATR